MIGQTSGRYIYARAVFGLLGLLLLSACGGGGAGGPPRYGALSSQAIECAPYARQVSGVALYGPAAGWWDAAAGRYDRGNQPIPGSVLVFRRTSRLPYGHVSVVSRVLSPRSILVTQANWVHHRVAREEPVVDVSDDNDWTQVRVWWAPSNQMGTSVFSTYGFITPSSPRVWNAGAWRKGD